MKTTMMDAWIKKSGVAGLTKARTTVPHITDENVLIRVLACGICGSDLSIYKGYREVPDNLIPGHELCGEVVEIGKLVSGYSVGDYVVPSIVNFCRKCWPCIHGYEAQCEELEEIGIHVDGGFAQYVSVPHKILHKVPRTMDPILAASIEPVAVAYTAVSKAKHFIPGSNAIVFGPGAIGLYIAQLLKVSGAREVIVVGAEGDDARLHLAKQYGVHTINAFVSNLDDEVKKIIPNKKVEFIFDATGVAGVVEDILKYLLPHGQLILAGIYKQPGSIDLLELVRNELTIQGTFCYTLSSFEMAIKLVIGNHINFDGIVDTYPLSQLDEAFDRALHKRSIKVIVKPVLE